MDVLVTYCIAEDFVVGSTIGCKARDRWLKLEHKRDVYESKQQNSTTKMTDLGFDISKQEFQYLEQCITDSAAKIFCLLTYEVEPLAITLKVNPLNFLAP